MVPLKLAFSAEDASTAGPLLVFLILIALINAPFDWASLGLTRALLRSGLELGGWWPYVLGLADALAGDRRDLLRPALDGP